MEVALSKLSVSQLTALLPDLVEQAQEHCADICADYVEPLPIEVARRDAEKALAWLAKAWAVVQELRQRTVE